MMNAYGSYTLLEAIGRKKNLKILLAHLVNPREDQFSMGYGIIFPLRLEVNAKWRVGNDEVDRLRRDVFIPSMQSLL